MNYNVDGKRMERYELIRVEALQVGALAVYRDHGGKVEAIDITDEEAKKLPRFRDFPIGN